MADKKKMEPIDYMKISIEEMKKSVQERRKEGEVSPKVGAVLLRPDGTYTTAYRGELRDGDHAEYTLLERKCINENLKDWKDQGTVLFFDPFLIKGLKYPVRNKE